MAATVAGLIASGVAAHAADVPWPVREFPADGFSIESPVPLRSQIYEGDKKVYRSTNDHHAEVGLGGLEVAACEFIPEVRASLSDEEVVQEQIDRFKAACDGTVLAFKRVQIGLGDPKVVQVSKVCKRRYHNDTYADSERYYVTSRRLYRLHAVVQGDHSTEVNPLLLRFYDSFKLISQ